MLEKKYSRERNHQFIRVVSCKFVYIEKNFLPIQRGLYKHHSVSSRYLVYLNCRKNKKSSQLRVSIATIIAISIPAKESHQMALTVCRTSRNECGSKWKKIFSSRKYYLPWSVRVRDQKYSVHAVFQWKFWVRYIGL